ncbi:uncharacterized protein ACUXSM_001774, partial [Burkholderia sp. 132550021-2]
SLFGRLVLETRFSRIPLANRRLQPSTTPGTLPVVMATPAAMGLQLTLATILIAFAGVFVIAFMRGAFGGGFAIIGIPLLSLVMDPVTAGGLLAPLFIAMDLFALRYWKPSTWSKPDLVLLLPGLVVGIGFGYLAFRFLDHRAIELLMAVVTLVFVGLWVRGGAEPTVRPRSSPKAVSAGLASGVTTMVAHSGGPPLAMYLLPLGLSKEMYAGTTSLFFTVGNAIKAVPWLLIVQPTANVWALMAVCLLAIPAGVVFGWRLHGRLDQRLIYRSCYGLLAVTALKLLWDGVSGYLA